MNKRTLGTQKEEMVAEFLAKQGIKILEKNFACKMGEIDLICLDKGCLDGTYMTVFQFGKVYVGNAYFFRQLIQGHLSVGHNPI